MKDEIIKHGRYDGRRESYRTFFDHSWYERFQGIAEGTKIERAAFDLGSSWRGVANTHTLPFLMAESGSAFAAGLDRVHNPFGRRWIALTKQRLVEEMKNKAPLRNMRVKALQQSLDEIYRQLEEDIAAQRLALTLDDFWHAIIDLQEFKFSLLGSQRLCYAAVYYAYEDFATRLVAVARNELDYRMQRHSEFKRDFRDAFGARIAERCWTDQGVTTARFIRHAIVHNGCRLTKDLRKHSHGLVVEDDEIQIMAPDTAALFHHLKDRAEELADAAVKLPPFQIP